MMSRNGEEGRPMFEARRIDAASRRSRLADAPWQLRLFVVAACVVLMIELSSAIAQLVSITLPGIDPTLPYSILYALGLFHALEVVYTRRGDRLWFIRLYLKLCVVVGVLTLLVHYVWEGVPPVGEHLVMIAWHIAQHVVWLGLLASPAIAVYTSKPLDPPAEEVVLGSNAAAEQSERVIAAAVRLMKDENLYLDVAHRDGGMVVYLKGRVVTLTTEREGIRVRSENHEGQLLDLGRNRRNIALVTDYLGRAAVAVGRDIQPA